MFIWVRILYTAVLDRETSAGYLFLSLGHWSLVGLGTSSVILHFLSFPTGWATGLLIVLPPKGLGFALGQLPGYSRTSPWSTALMWGQAVHGLRGQGYSHPPSVPGCPWAVGPGFSDPLSVLQLCPPPSGKGRGAAPRGNGKMMLQGHPLPWDTIQPCCWQEGQGQEVVSNTTEHLLHIKSLFKYFSRAIVHLFSAWAATPCPLTSLRQTCGLSSLLCALCHHSMCPVTASWAPISLATSRNKVSATPAAVIPCCSSCLCTEK